MRHQPTEAEKKFWAAVRDRRLGGHKFKRQFLVRGCITDFVCVERRLIVELDGGQHAERKALDARRDALLASGGFRIVRFWNDDVLRNLEGVLDAVLKELEVGSPSP